MKDRFGESLLRAPYVWLAVTIVLMFVANTPLFAIVSDREESQTWIAVVAAVLIAYNVVVWFVLLPRLVARSGGTITPPRLAAVRWAFAICPYVIAFAAVGLGGDEWIYGPGWLTSILLLVLTARAIRGEASAPA